MKRTRTKPRPHAAAWFVGLALVAAGCSSPAQTPEGDVRGPETGLPSSTAMSDETVTVVTVGDIVCASDGEVTDTECQQQATADLASSLQPDAVVALGDLQYESGSLDEFERSWAPGWGRFDDIIAPVPGNHEYQTEGAADYIRYFDTGPYYARQIGAWRFYLLNSNCEQIDCVEEAQWLADDLAANPTTCTAIAMHHPRWSSAAHGNQDQVDVLWAAAAEGGVDLSLSAHDHDYERFAPIDAAGEVTGPSQGTTHFVVGTGGRSLYEFRDERRPGSEAAVAGSFGVLDLILRPDAFEWRFVDLAGETLDKGGQDCV